MPHLFAICDIVGGLPNVPAVPGLGWAHHGTLGQYGAYLFVGSAAQLTALNALPNVIGLIAMTNAPDDEKRWLELDGALPTALRTRINNWLTARGRPNIPTGQTYRQVVRAIFRHFADMDPLESVFVK